MKYKAVIFDMDGLILDTESIESRAHKKILDEFYLFNNDILLKSILYSGLLESNTSS